MNAGSRGPDSHVTCRFAHLTSARVAATALFILVLASGFVQTNASSEAWDIGATVFQDQFCMERHSDMLLLEGACYSTVGYTNTSVAFKVKIVGYGYKGSEWVIDYQEFSDDCRTPVMTPESLRVGACAGFIGRFRGKLRTKFRSDKCSGAEKCSNMAIGEQNFFASDDCSGETMVKFRYRTPLQGECMMRHNMSSTKYILDPDMSTVKVKRIDYPGNDKCAGLNVLQYDISDKCYSLFDSKAPRSFKWTAHRKSLLASSGSAISPWKSLFLAVSVLVCIKRI